MTNILLIFSFFVFVFIFDIFFQCFRFLGPSWFEGSSIIDPFMVWGIIGSSILLGFGMLSWPWSLFSVISSKHFLFEP